jgi:hypothetical protein
MTEIYTVGNPSRFISFGPWESLEVVDACAPPLRSRRVWRASGSSSMPSSLAPTR